MKNIEFKARCRDLEILRRILREQGLSPDCRMHQVDTYFRVPTGRLKLREIDGERAELIHYHRADQAEARESDYQIVEVSDPAGLKRALQRALGIRVVVDKLRELYLWNHTRVHLDQVRDLGSYMELETVIRGITPEQARAECREIREALGIREDDLETGSYADLMPSAGAVPVAR